MERGAIDARRHYVPGEVIREAKRAPAKRSALNL